MLRRTTVGLLVASLLASGCHADVPAPGTNAGGDAATTATTVTPAPTVDAATTANIGDAAGADAGDAQAKSLAGAGSFETQGAHCLADPNCPASEAERLFREGDDEKQRDVDCSRFSQGIGVTKDVARARACFTRELKDFCKEGTMGFSESTLMLSMIDGIGGPRDVAGARKMMAACPDDVTRDAVLAHADAVDKDPTTKAADACKDVGGTTLFTQDCAAEAYMANEAHAQLAAKQIAAGLDATGKQLFAAANKAYDAYASAWGGYKYEKYKDGSIRSVVSLSAQNQVLARRVADLGRFSTFTAKPVAAAMLVKDESDVQARTKALADRESEADAKKACLDTQTAWSVYRDAEVAFDLYANANQPPADVKATTLARVYANRKRDLAN